MLFDFTIADNTITGIFNGRLDTTSVNLMTEQFDSFIKDATNKEVIIDCTDLEYISSSGLRLLLKLRKNISNTITLKGVNIEIMNILKITKLDASFQYAE